MILKVLSILVLCSSLLFAGITLAQRAESLGKSHQSEQVSMDFLKGKVRK